MFSMKSGLPFASLILPDSATIIFYVYGTLPGLSPSRTFYVANPFLHSNKTQCMNLANVLTVADSADSVLTRVTVLIVLATH